MSHLPLDARAILEYLNELGYRNISAEQLKEFMKDLRKLIKYEEHLGVNANQDDYFENLFKRTTASYRAKVDQEENAQRKLKVSNYTKEPEKTVFQKRRDGEKKVMRSNENVQQDIEVEPDKHAHFQDKTRLHTNSARTNSSSTESIDLTTERNKERNQVLDGLRSLTFRGQSSVVNEHNIRSHQHLRDRSTNSTRRPTAFTPRAHKTDNKNLATDQNTLVTRGATPNIRRRPIDENDYQSRWNPTTAHNTKARHERSTSRETATNKQHVRHTNRVPDSTCRSVTNTMISTRIRSRTRSRKPLAHDPVALYHYYQQEWKHFRCQIPGENSHSNLRWQIRHKLLDPQ